MFTPQNEDEGYLFGRYTPEGEGTWKSINIFRKIPKNWKGIKGGRALSKLHSENKGFQGIRGMMLTIFQKKMVKNKDKAKRLIDSPCNAKGTLAKIARTSEQEASQEEERKSPIRSLMTDMLDCQDIPTTPSQTERSLCEDVNMDSPKEQRPHKERVTRISETQDSGPAMRKQESGKFEARLEGLLAKPNWEEASREGLNPVEEQLDWKIPAAFRVDWITARVDQLLIQMDVVGGMYEPVFVLTEPSPVKVTKVKQEALTPKKEPSASLN